MGLAYHKQRKYDKAIDGYEMAVSIDSELAYAHYNLACAYSLKNEKTLAIKTLQKAITLNQKYIEMSKTDSDFDNIRSSPEFQQLIK